MLLKTNYLSLIYNQLLNFIQKTKRKKNAPVIYKMMLANNYFYIVHLNMEFAFKQN